MLDTLICVKVYVELLGNVIATCPPNDKNQRCQLYIVHVMLEPCWLSICCFLTLVSPWFQPLLNLRKICKLHQWEKIVTKARFTKAVRWVQPRDRFNLRSNRTLQLFCSQSRDHYVLMYIDIVAVIKKMYMDIFSQYFKAQFLIFISWK